MKAGVSIVAPLVEAPFVWTYGWTQGARGDAKGCAMPPRIRVMSVVMICLALGACAVSSPQPGQTLSPTNRPLPTDTPPAGTFFFATEDGVKLNGQIIG